MRAAFEVSGRVQGVGFRWHVRRRARELGLSGWTRNEPGGTVLVVAEGEAPGLDALLDTLRAGPPGARVEGVRRLAMTADETLPNPFEIR